MGPSARPTTARSACLPAMSFIADQLGTCRKPHSHLLPEREHMPHRNSMKPFATQEFIGVVRRILERIFRTRNPHSVLC